MDNFSNVGSNPSTPPAQSMNEIWEKACSVLRQELSEHSFKTWFELIRVVSIDGSAITLGVPDNYYGKWLQDHYQNLIVSSVEEACGKVLKIIYLATPKKAPPLSFSLEKNTQKSVSTPGLNSSYNFDNFVIGPGNRFAHAAAVAVSEAPARHYNPLFIYGRAGLGKTHLLQSIAHETRKRFPNSKVLYISSEKFTNQLISAIQTRTTHQFRSKYRGLDLILIDDIHFIAGKEATQEEFFHTFNTLYDAHKQIVVSSDRHPKDIPGLEERLVTRFAWGLVTDIHPPDFETRVAILKKKMEKETVVVPDDVSFFIAEKIKSNIRELEGALIRVVAYCTLTGATLDIALARDVLGDAFKEEAKKFSIDGIQKNVASYFGLSVSDLKNKRRTRSMVRPRQIAMFLVRKLTSHSFPEIGEFFGGKDHTTVLHAYNKILKEREVDIELKKTLDSLVDILKKDV